MVGLRLRVTVEKPPVSCEACVRPPEVKPGTAVPSTGGGGLRLGGEAVEVRVEGLWGDEGP